MRRKKRTNGGTDKIHPVVSGLCFYTLKIGIFGQTKNGTVPKETFMALVGRHTDNPGPAERGWDEIAACYTDKKRHYHTLQHLSNLLVSLESVRKNITDWDTVLFALFYHDIVYKATRKDNEEKSAELARLRLEAIGYPADRTARCVAHILATKSHAPGADGDTDLFTDADLGILGADEATYREYARQVRAEYAVYPDFMYYPGRRKVLAHFLEMPYIFKTPEFRHLFEEQARTNLKNEYALLV